MYCSYYRTELFLIIESDVDAVIAQMLSHYSESPFLFELIAIGNRITENASKARNIALAETVVLSEGANVQPWAFFWKREHKRLCSSYIKRNRLIDGGEHTETLACLLAEEVSTINDSKTKSCLQFQNYVSPSWHGSHVDTHFLQKYHDEPFFLEYVVHNWIRIRKPIRL